VHGVAGTTSLSLLLVSIMGSLPVAESMLVCSGNLIVVVDLQCPMESIVVCRSKKSKW